MKRKRQKQPTIFYVITLAFGLMVLYFFSLLPMPTGFATADVCGDYVGDSICDDSPADCGIHYKPGTSEDSCNECQTGWFDCSATATTGPESPKCISYFGDSVCDDSQEDCGDHFKPQFSAADCNECQTGGFNCKIKSDMPNLYISSVKLTFPEYFESDDKIKTKTGLYGVKTLKRQCLVHVPLHFCNGNAYYEINNDGSIILTSSGKEQRIKRFHLDVEVSNNGQPTYEPFYIAVSRFFTPYEIQRHKLILSSVDLVASDFVLLEPSAHVDLELRVPNTGHLAGNLLSIRDGKGIIVLIDGTDRIKESNENDNSFLIDLPIRDIGMFPDTS